MNRCEFSPDRIYRYVLTHRWEELMPQREICWIGLNPSTADENKLDPTLTRIKGFSTSLGFNAFHMLNLFAFRSTDPKRLRACTDPIGPDNDYWLRTVTDSTELVVACWGGLGNLLNRAESVINLLGCRLDCLGLTQKNNPCHPLYLPAKSTLQPYIPSTRSMYSAMQADY